MTNLMKNKSFYLHNHRDNSKGKFMRNSVLAALACIALVLTLTAPPAHATGYTLTPFDYTGASSTSLCGINNNGQIVGTYRDQTGRQYSFIYDYVNNSYTPLKYITADNNTTNTYAGGINDSGQVCGNYDEPTGQSSSQQRGFIYYNGVYTSLYCNGSTASSNAEAINNNGDVIVTSGFNTYLRDNGGHYTTINLPNEQALWGLNNSDIAVGYDYSSHQALICDLSNGTSSYFDFPYPDNNYFQSTFASDINNSGAIVGDYAYADSDYNYYYYGFVKQGDSFTTIAYPGATETDVLGINDSGQIAGQYYDSNGVKHGFIGDPVATPIPSSVLLLGFGLLRFVPLRRRKS